MSFTDAESRNNDREVSVDEPVSQVAGTVAPVLRGTGFPKAKRLLRRSDFQRVYQEGRRQFTGNMTVFFLRRDNAETASVGSFPRVGFTVGKVLGGSVERNRIRRRMRAAVRLAWPVLQGSIDVVLNPRRSVLDLSPADLSNEVVRSLKLATQRATVSRQADDETGQSLSRAAKSANTRRL